VLFNGCDADFELEPFVDLALLKLAEPRVEAIDVVFGRHLFAKIGDFVFGRHLAFDIGDIVGDRGEAALYLSLGPDGREDAVEHRLGFLGRLLLCGHTLRA
jgi:hypothetical protein